ncbi:MAG: hypothetical protein M0T84_18200 [Betaproteobacteria bacterium]|nr:hypothetical protein [Betaproteobacteria bacterium]
MLLLLGAWALSLWCASATAAAASAGGVQWLAKLVERNDGKAFCAPATTTIQEFAGVLVQYANAHGITNINDAQGVRAWAKRYPCASNSASVTRPVNSSDKPQPIDSYQASGAPIKTITPIFSQLLSMSLPAAFGPSLAYQATTSGTQYIQESVPVGENVNNWTQMLTVTGAKDMAQNPKVSPEKLVEYIATDYKKACPASFSAVAVPVGKISGFDTFSAIVSCGQSPMTRGRTSESAMILAIKGERDYYTVQWARRGAPSSTPIVINEVKWATRFKRLAPIRLCPVIPGEHAPYPSCVNQR